VPGDGPVKVNCTDVREKPVHLSSG
jgi:hypothetical protein